MINETMYAIQIDQSVLICGVINELCMQQQMVYAVSQDKYTNVHFSMFIIHKQIGLNLHICIYILVSLSLSVYIHIYMSVICEAIKFP